MVVKLQRSDPFAQLSVRIDTNMPEEAGLTHTNLADYLQQNVAELYRQYPDFHQVSNVPTTLLRLPATELIFTYLGLDKKTHFTMVVIGLTINNKPYYFEFQAKEADFENMLKNFAWFTSSVKQQP